MEPNEFNPTCAALLPAGYELHRLAENQPQYRPLPIAKLPGDEGRIISRWTFSDDERARIAAGEDLFIEMLTFGVRPMPILPTIGLRNFNQGSLLE